jgi:hypothetical protein
MHTRSINPQERNTLLTYVPVTNHVYYDGFSFRVRAVKKGVKTSRNFPKLKPALKYRNELLLTST